MATWIVGDIHGCSEEFSSLLSQLELQPSDSVVSVGDLFHRGPDPVGVLDLMESVGARFILGNHEMRMLDRFGLAPQQVDGSDRPPLRTEFENLAPEDMAGDGGRPCHVPEERRADVLRFLQGHAGFFSEHAEIAGSGMTPDQRPWCVVHAGLLPGRHPEDHHREELTSLRRLPQRGKPYWYERYSGPNLVVFGHTPSKTARVQRVGGLVVAMGVDTGCVYGGRLTAYCPERDELQSVAAQRKYASP